MTFLTPASSTTCMISSKLSRVMPPVGSSTKSLRAHASASALGSSWQRRPPIGKNLMELPPISRTMSMAVSAGTSAGALDSLEMGPVETFTRPGYARRRTHRIDVALVISNVRAGRADLAERLVEVVRLDALRDLGDHVALLGVAATQAYREVAIENLHIAPHVLNARGRPGSPR